MTEENETNFSEILTALTNELSCEALHREADGRVLFTIDDALGVALFTTDEEESSIDTLIATIVLGPAPVSNAALLYRLLSANYLGGETADGTLAIDEEAGCLVLTRVFTFPLDVESFVPAFARLVNAARYWADVVVRDLSDTMGDATVMTWA